MYSDSGTPLTFSNTVTNTGGASTGGSNPTDNPVTYTARNVVAEKPVEYRLQPWKEDVDWISGDPTEQGQFNMRFAVTHNNTEATYYESVAAMRDALINEHTSSETLVYTMKKGQPPVLDTENSSSSVTPAEIDWTTGSWSAVFKDMPTYQRVNEGGKEIFRVYSYDIEEIQVNGQTVTDGKTDEYQVEAATGDPVTGQDGVVTTTTDITNTEMSIPVTLLKTDDTENSTNYLSGAIFELQYKKTSDGTWQKASKTEITQLNDLSRFTIPGDADGITLTGLKAGFYQLVEISPPIGYIITNETPVAFEVKRGEISSTDGTVEGVRYTAKGADNDASFIIPNTPGVSLPHTGGPGTRLFTVLGAVLTLGAGVLLWRRRRLI
jgi:LPXTG-motif cell wall-anchored protein